MFNRYIFLIVSAILFSNCTKTPQIITSANDYRPFLENEVNESLIFAKAEKKYWKQKYEESPNQISYLSKLAASHTMMFECGGTIDDLKSAEKYLVAANKKVAYKEVGFLHALAKNYVTQHRFKEALELLKSAEKLGERKRATHKMLFDVYLELGDTKRAEKYLNAVKDMKDFDYLIRLSKWQDHNGNLDAAIRIMEKAKMKAKTSNNKELLLWSYSNLADFYGHAGRIQDSYDYYLKALLMNPDYTYALRGIAWIAYSYEKNTAKASEILTAIAKKNNTPDLQLFKAEIAAFEKNRELEDAYVKEYLNMVSDRNYGDMYNSYTVGLYAESDKQIQSALATAYREIENRPTPQSYALLAWTLYKKENPKEALRIVRTYVEDKTFEPAILYQIAAIYKANELDKRTVKLKKELLESTFELGPLLESKIKQL